MPRAPSEKVTQAEKLFNDGMAMVEIAKKLEVSDGTVRSWKNRYGWGKASKKTSATLRKKMRRKMQRCKRKRGEVNPKIRMQKAVLAIQTQTLHQTEQSMAVMFLYLWMRWIQMSRNFLGLFQKIQSFN